MLYFDIKMVLKSVFICYGFSGAKTLPVGNNRRKFELSRSELTFDKLFDKEGNNLNKKKEGIDRRMDRPNIAKYQLNENLAESSDMNKPTSSLHKIMGLKNAGKRKHFPNVHSINQGGTKRRYTCK